VISADHAALLEAAAIDLDVARRAGVESITEAIQLPEELRWLGGQEHGLPGLLFWWRDLNDRHVPQYRPDEAVTLNGKPCKYLFAKDARPPVWVHPVMTSRLEEPRGIVIVEGTKQYLAAVSVAGPDVLVVGIVGCAGWMQEGVPLPDLARLRVANRVVVTVFDADLTTNRNVWDQARNLGAHLEALGASGVRHVQLPAGRTSGLDDYLGISVPEDQRPGVFEQMTAKAGKLPRAPKRVRVRGDTPPESSARVHAYVSEPPELASDQDILARFTRALRVHVVGEDATAQLLYLVLTSRLLDKPVSAAVKGDSSSGKSHTTEAVVAFFPPGVVIALTAMSERSLVYRDDDYRHRTLVLYEATALREDVPDNLTAYFVRSLLSEGHINYEVTVRDEAGNFTTRTITKDGPTNLIITTTKTQVHAENETRLLSLTTDDTREQTKRILYALAKETNAEIDYTQWHQLQGWLQQADHRVTIPYAQRLADLVTPVAVRLRRDFGALLALIRTHAILHQQTRARDADGRIIATLADYTKVRELVAGIVATGVGIRVSPAVRETVQAVDHLTNPHTASSVTARTVAGRLDIDRSAASRRLHVAADAGYLVNLEDRPFRPGRWALGDPLPADENVFPSVHALMSEGDERPGQSTRARVHAKQGGIPPHTRNGQESEPPVNDVPTPIGDTMPARDEARRRVVLDAEGTVHEVP
jgi:hypothetical protein